jgi:hypothetical protein
MGHRLRLRDRTDWKGETMKFFLNSLVFVLSLSACAQTVKPPAEDQKVASARMSSGLWVAPSIPFTTDQCGLRLQLEISADNFLVQDFLVHCQQRGGSGLFAPLQLSILKSSEFSAADIQTLGAPSTADILATRDSAGSLTPRGWFDTATNQFSIQTNPVDSLLWNQLRLDGQILSEQAMVLTRVEMRDGVQIDDRIPLSKFAQQAPDQMTFQRTVWQKLNLPSTARVATHPADQNYLYCTGFNSASASANVHLAGTRYRIEPSGRIGEFGFLDLRASSSVETASPVRAIATTAQGSIRYALQLQRAGGVSTYLNVDFVGDGRAVTRSPNTTYLCQALLNDLYAGYSGWYP